MVGVGAVGGDGPPAESRHFTFRWTPDGYVEDEFLRGLHPLLGARLGLPAADFGLLFRQLGPSLALWRAAEVAALREQVTFVVSAIGRGLGAER